MDFLYVGKVIQDKLFRRFLLRDYPLITDPFFFHKVIVGVTQVDELFRAPKGTLVTGQDLSPSAGTMVDEHLCPPGKRWIVKRFISGATTGTTMLRYRANATDADMGLEGASSNSAKEIELNDIKVDEGGAIGRDTTGNGSDNAASSGLVYEEEDSFR